jgi:hypothetical protein
VLKAKFAPSTYKEMLSGRGEQGSRENDPGGADPPTPAAITYPGSDGPPRRREVSAEILALAPITTAGACQKRDVLRSWTPKIAVSLARKTRPKAIENTDGPFLLAIAVFLLVLLLRMSTRPGRMPALTIASHLFNNVFGLVICKVVFAPEPGGFPDDIAQPIGELRVRLFTAHFASFCAAALPL